MKLNQSPVTFTPEDHTYHLGDKLLQGITGIIHRHICPNKYDGIPQSVLNKAAERGTMIHETCELIDDLGIEPTTDEGLNYIKIKGDNSLKYECSEYLVSDNEYVASCIDKVYRVSPTKFILADIKTTSVLDLEYVTWQLSIYAYLFERQNPKAKVSALTAIWLRGDKYKYETCTRIPNEEIERLLLADRNGEIYTMPSDLVKQETSLDIPSDLINEVIAIQRQAEEASRKLEELKQGLLLRMKENNVKSFDCDALRLTYIAESESQSFDSKAFKAEHPDLYDQYIKTTKRKESIKLTIR